MKVSELSGYQTINDIVSVAPGMLVSEAVGIMATANIGAVPVLDGSKLVGIFSERDLMVKVVAKHLNPEDVHIEDVMTYDLVTIDPDCSTDQALGLMKERNFRHLPIKDADEHLVGIVSIKDFV